MPETPSSERAGCPEPDLSRHLANYCFGEASSVERDAFERHLIGCEFCRAEVERLSAAVRLLRTDKSLRDAVSGADLAALVGISAKYDLSFFGHLRHVLLTSALHALNYVFILFIEVAYGFDTYGTGAFKIAPLIFLFMFLASVGSFALDERLIRRGRPSSLWPNLTLVASAIVLYFGVCLFLPNHPIIHVTVTAYSAQTSYLKDVLFIVPMSILFLLRPFHFIGSMQRQLAKGQHHAALNLLRNEKNALPPRGLAFPSTKVLIAVILVAVLYVVPGAFRLFDMLVPGPYTSLFSKLILVRWVFYFTFLGEALLWYRSSITELKRECLVVVSDPGNRQI